ncbi:hypothetical protein CVT26_004812 [Gymnopilus dilepis]|uniref:DUF8205 domain-containing protein n=1 Tax=Gymnopilus dilepis TaxID=231916 RepID=A0A409XZG5_9AGAR|nr:hypothetical protein CVT26_004812 [Gymnopilus dilepis]
MFRLHLLDEDSLRAVSSKPLELIVVVQHEPFQLKDFLQLFDIAALDREEAVAGMPQVVAVSTRREEDMIPSHIESWRESRKLHADFTAKGEYPTVLLTIKQMAAGPGTMFAVTELTIGITIVERMMSHVKHPENSPLDTMPTPTGNIDTDVKNAVQSLNEIIRFDVINFFRLRVRLSRLEKVMISLASVSFPEDDATSTTPLIQEILERAFNCPGRQPMLDPPSRVYIQMLQKKIARERIYRSAVTYSGPELEGARRDILAQHIDSAEEQPVPECKTSFYCSKEVRPSCQLPKTRLERKCNRPIHKRVCNAKTGGDHAVTDSFNNLARNLGFRRLLQLLAIYKHGLHLLDDEALERIKSTPLELVIIVQYEPAEAKDFLRLFDVDATAREAPVTAIPQIVAVSSRKGVDVVPTSIDMWKLAYNEHAGDPVAHKLPIVVLRVEPMALVQGSDNLEMLVCPRLTCSFQIEKSWMRCAKGLETLSLQIVELQMPPPIGNVDSDVRNLVQFFNELVRFDADDLFRLRVKMPWLEQVMVSLASAFTLEEGGLSPIPAIILETLEKNFACAPGHRLGLDPSALSFIEQLLKKIARERFYRLAIFHTGPELRGLRRDILARHIVLHEGWQQVPEVPEIRPTHKFTCNPAGGAYSNVLNNMVGNPFMEWYLNLLVIYKQGLHLLDEESLQSLKSRPLELAILLQYEPVEIQDFLELFDVASIEDRRLIRGMAQITAASIVSEEDMSQSALDHWKLRRKVYLQSQSRGGSDIPLEFMLRVYHLVPGTEAMPISIRSQLVTVNIGEIFMNFARHGTGCPLDMPKPVGDSQTDVKNIIESANELIRRDVKDRMHYRVWLTMHSKLIVSLASVPEPSHIEGLIKDSQTEEGPVGGPSSPLRMMNVTALNRFLIEAMRKKVVRERVYLEAAERYGYEAAAARMGRTGIPGDIVNSQVVPDIWRGMLN